MNNKIKYAIILTAISFLGILGLWQMEKDRSVVTYNKDNLIRFHVLANSNSVEDQALKYQVRDIIINSMAKRFEGVQDVAQARRIVEESLADIRDLSTDYIRTQGYAYTVSASLGDYPFPDKSYNLGRAEGKTDLFTLPADTYEAVRVVIGAGNGANWWCILFPPLCFVDFNSAPEQQEKGSCESNEEEEKQETVKEDAAVKAFKLTAPTEAQLQEFTEANNRRQTQTDSIQLRFRCVELFNNASSWYSRKFG